MNFTKKQLEELKAAGKIKGYSKESLSSKEANIRKSKYGAKKTEVDGILFDSAKEAKRYVELRYMKMTGQITDLLLQVEFELNPGGTHSLVYVADFVYKELRSGEVIVEDVKGYRTKEYKKKRRLMLEVHGIEIKEI